MVVRYAKGKGGRQGAMKQYFGGNDNPSVMCMC